MYLPLVLDELASLDVSNFTEGIIATLFCKIHLIFYTDMLPIVHFFPGKVQKCSACQFERYFSVCKI